MALKNKKKLAPQEKVEMTPLPQSHCMMVREKRHLANENDFVIYSCIWNEKQIEKVNYLFVTFLILDILIFLKIWMFMFGFKMAEVVQFKKGDLVW